MSKSKSCEEVVSSDISSMRTLLFASVLCAAIFYATSSPVLMRSKSLENEEVSSSSVAPAVSTEAAPVPAEAPKLKETARQSGDDDDDDDDDDDLDLGVDDDDDDDDEGGADDDDSDDDDYFESIFDDLLGGKSTAISFYKIN